MNTILVTGGAGFIGYHCIVKLLQNNTKVVCLDNINEYYSVKLKNDRINQLKLLSNFYFEKVDILQKNSLFEVFEKYKPKYVLHFAAQAGVRYSIENPDIYISTNINGFFNVLDCCRKFGVDHTIFASSSSVYGNNSDEYFSENSKSDEPVSIYAATKKADEEIAYAMAKTYGLNITGLRFFTVYGPWGRPDMAYFLFSDAIRKGKKVKIYNYGNVYRDYTYVEDVAEVVNRLLPIYQGKGNFQIYNVAHGKTYSVKNLISFLESEFDVVVEKEYVGRQVGDVDRTQADTRLLYNRIGFQPNTDLEEGIKKFYEWYKSYYHLK